MLMRVAQNWLYCRLVQWGMMHYPRRKRGGMNNKGLLFDGSKGPFPFLPMKKTTEPNNVILVVFVIALEH